MAFFLRQSRMSAVKTPVVSCGTVMIMHTYTLHWLVLTGLFRVKRELKHDVLSHGRQPEIESVFPFRDRSLIMGWGGGGRAGGKLGGTSKKIATRRGGGLPKVFRLMRGGGLRKKNKLVFYHLLFHHITFIII